MSPDPRLPGASCPSAGDAMTMAPEKAMRNWASTWRKWRPRPSASRQHYREVPSRIVEGSGLQLGPGADQQRGFHDRSSPREFNADALVELRAGTHESRFSPCCWSSWPFYRGGWVQSNPTGRYAPRACILKGRGPRGLNLVKKFQPHNVIGIILDVAHPCPVVANGDHSIMQVKILAGPNDVARDHSCRPGIGEFMTSLCSQPGMAPSGSSVERADLKGDDRR